MRRGKWRGETFAERAYGHILGQLFSGEIRPGEPLDRRQIAAELKVSLIPVADAVQRLTNEGFLTTRRRQGTFVRTPGIADVRGQFLLREALECQSARLYCGERIQRNRRHLLPLAKAADKAADSGRPIFEEDFAFHQALIDLTDCEALVSCFRRVVNLSMFHQTALISPLEAAGYDRHVLLLDELGEATPDASEARIRRHLRTGKERLFEEAMTRTTGKGKKTDDE